MSHDFAIITSIRWDRMLGGNAQNAAFAATVSDWECQFYMLSLHRDRLVEASKAFGRDWNVLEGGKGLITLEQQLQARLSNFAGSLNCEAPVKVKTSRQ